MSNLEKVFVFFFLIFSIMIGVGFWSIRRREEGKTPGDNGPLFLSRHRSAFVYRAVFPLLLILISISGFLAAYGATLLLLGLYCGVLLLLRPVYRNFLRAESCASLWGLVWIPIAFRHPRFGTIFPPRLYLSLPLTYPNGSVTRWLAGIWLAGFVGVMLWSILSHIRYRKWLLKGATPVQEDTVTEAFRKQQRIIRFWPEHITLWVSGKTATPISVGLFWRTTCIVLPEKQYTQKELDLIFRHELVHICRRDSLTKLEMTLCCALMWFNPLVWLAVRACAEDLELSCDEAVLYGYPSQIRKNYAELLLQTTATQQGFTTCLSASAKALRYRLKSIIKPGKRLAGGIFAAILSLVLMLSFSYIGVRFQPEQAKHLLFQNEDLRNMQVGDIMIITSQDHTSGGECEKDRELLEYISDLSLRWVSGPHEVNEDAHIQIIVQTEGTNQILTFGKTHLRVLSYTYANTGSSTMRTDYYEVVSQQDWNFIRSCIQD